ncbi:MAG TPA: ribokinase [Propionicimonas sp.]
MSKRDILVVGSINVDLLLFQDRLPARGETFLANGLREEFGGKGANQAVQAARLGQTVRFLGAVGTDERGRGSEKNLIDNGIDCHLGKVDIPTGLGVVNILPGGEVHATILRGANEAVTPSLVRDNAELFTNAGLVILQNEIPAEANAEAVRCAVEAGARVIYNAAPARDVDPALTRACAYLVVNEEEAAHFLGRRVDDLEAMTTAITELHVVCPRVIVTMGAAGSVLSTLEGVTVIPVQPVNAVDTTGAGDAYVAAFASALNDGSDEVAAARIAATVAAMATRSVGAQTSMPKAQDVQDDSVRA